MIGFVGRTTAWVGRHAFPAAAVGVLAAGAVGGGVGYAVAGGSAPTAAPVTAGVSPQAATSGKHKHAGIAARAVQEALKTLSQDTGKSVATIRSELRSGQSIDQIAGAQASAVENAWLAEIQKIADRAVKAGRISASQEQADLASLKVKLDALMAEPGTNLLKDARAALGFLPAAGHGGSTASPSPTAGS